MDRGRHPGRERQTERPGRTEGRDLQVHIEVLALAGRQDAVRLLHQPAELRGHLPPESLKDGGAGLLDPDLRVEAPCVAEALHGQGDAELVHLL